MIASTFCPFKKGMTLRISVAQKKQLKRLGFQVVNKNNYLEVISSPWRNDINVEADLVEEILRISGYENIKSKFLTFRKKIKVRPKRRQDAPKVYQLNGLYTYNTKKFLKYKKNVDTSYN